MEHPSSPMGAMPMQDGRGPHSPADPRQRGGDTRYRPPPPGYGHAPAGYPQYHGYGGPPQSPYGGHPNSQSFQSRPPPGHYPPPHAQQSPAYAYNYPPGPRGPPGPPGPGGYPYGAEGMYPGQPGRPSQSFRPNPAQGSPPQQMMGQPPHKVGSSPSPKSSPTRSPQENNPSSRVTPKVAHQVEVERLRAAAAAELTHEEVKPIQSEFHFFVKENVAKHRPLAEEEVKKSLKENEKLDPFLVNSNLNARLIRAWEELPKDKRESYMIKEEEDRRRFMEEDEIASRHCATLTARGKSPRAAEKTEKGVKGEEQEANGATPEPAKGPAPSSESETAVKTEAAENTGKDEGAMEEDSTPAKRALPEDAASGEDADAKRNKTSTEA